MTSATIAIKAPASPNAQPIKLVGPIGSAQFEFVPAD